MGRVQECITLCMNGGTMANEHTTEGNTKVKEARERSVNNLQRLYTVVISLAIMVSLKNLFEPPFVTVPNNGNTT